MQAPANTSWGQVQTNTHKFVSSRSCDNMENPSHPCGNGVAPDAKFYKMYIFLTMIVAKTEYIASRNENGLSPLKRKIWQYLAKLNVPLPFDPQAHF